MKSVAQIAQLRAAFECILIKHGEIEDSNRFLIKSKIKWWNVINCKYGEIEDSNLFLIKHGEISCKYGEIEDSNLFLIKNGEISCKYGEISLTVSMVKF